MLQFMRTHAKFFYVFFFLIIISFIFFYVGPVDKTTTVSVAEVGREKITLEEYGRAYERTREMYRDIYKEKFDEELEKKLKLRERVVDAMIDEKVLLIAAKDLGIKVTDAELEEAIMNEPGFTRNGVFDKSIYLRILELNRITPPAFESIKRKELTLTKMKRLIGESVDLTGNEIKQIQGDEQTSRAFRQALLFEKREKAVKSYVDGLKMHMKITINDKLIS